MLKQAVEMDGAPPCSRAAKSHSEAERKRRQRINGHLATLRTLLPAVARMDKATLLGEVVRRVRELRGSVGEAAAMGEADEVGVEEDEEAAGQRVRAWVCCADRPGLMGELSRAVGSVRGRAVRAEMATVGGRTRSVMELELVEAEETSTVKDALWAVLMSTDDDGRGSVVAAAGEKQKRQRLSTAGLRFSRT